ncbi:MAG TPA: cyclic pyranopterin monophosphate synthase MoaC [Gemmatimonadaceae bacterium]|nr:cyclic pyranopterin monophosphate synthase MoaC [Gemmatimonadaceae bacterium]
MSELSHIDDAGQARMVDISDKPDTVRMARASGTIRMNAETLAAIVGNMVAKGDVIGVARVAGIMAAKRTADLVPLCHPLPLDAVDVVVSPDGALPGLRVEVTVRTTASTGVEMEAITAVSVTLITLYDMAKALEKGMVIGEISLLEKSGGRSGRWVRPPA